VRVSPLAGSSRRALAAGSAVITGLTRRAHHAIAHLRRCGIAPCASPWRRSAVRTPRRARRTGLLSISAVRITPCALRTVRTPAGVWTQFTPWSCGTPRSAASRTMRILRQTDSAPVRISPRIFASCRTPAPLRTSPRHADIHKCGHPRRGRMVDAQTDATPCSSTPCGHAPLPGSTPRAGDHIHTGLHHWDLPRYVRILCAVHHAPLRISHAMRTPPLPDSAPCAVPPLRAYASCTRQYPAPYACGITPVGSHSWTPHSARFHHCVPLLIARLHRTTTIVRTPHKLQRSSAVRTRPRAHHAAGSRRARLAARDSPSVPDSRHRGTLRRADATSVPVGLSSVPRTLAWTPRRALRTVRTHHAVRGLTPW
jgi:hypothetical protein